MDLAQLLGRRSGGGKVVVELDLSKPIVERHTSPLAPVLNKGQLEVRQVVDGLRRAAEDPRVVGLYAKIDQPATSMAHVQELRDAVLAFRTSGKPAVAFSDTFGEFGRGTGAYYLATAFDEIWLQPSGDVGLVGWAAESTFLAGALEKLGITPRMDHRHEYKAAMYQFTERSFTPPHREEVEAVASSVWSQVVAGIAEARGLDDGKVRQLASSGPHLGHDALAAGLVDHLGYRDEAIAAAKARAGGAAELLYLQKLKKPGAAGSLPIDLDALGLGSLSSAFPGLGGSSSSSSVALVHASGAIVRGKGGGFNPLTGGPSLGGDAVAAAIRAAVADKRVRAIVLRVDSPGGSYVASDTIWREVGNARRSGKPVVVSMARVAGSGGYFVAMGADRIVAQPATVTGSIGVVGGKQVVAGLKQKLGLTTDEAHEGDTALMFSATYDFNDAAWAKVQTWLDRCYEDFTSKVAEGRGLAKDEVLRIAKGRIYSGADALDIGLVDELGGLDVAVRRARELGGLPDDADVVVFPKRTSPLQQVLASPSSSEDPAAAAVLAVPGAMAILGLDRAVAASPVGSALSQLAVLVDATALAMPVIPPGTL